MGLYRWLDGRGNQIFYSPREQKSRDHNHTGTPTIRGPILMGLFLITLSITPKVYANMDFLKNLAVDTALSVAGRIYRSVKNQEEKNVKGRSAATSAEKSVDSDEKKKENKE